MATVQEQATLWIKQALHFDAPFEAEIIALVPEIPLNWTTLPYCPACESVLCGACGHCHGLDLLPSHPGYPGDNDDIGRDCVARCQALKAIVTVQGMSEESEDERTWQTLKRSRRIAIASAHMGSFSRSPLEI